MIKSKKSMKGKTPSRRKFFKTAAAAGVAAVAMPYVNLGAAQTLKMQACLLYTSPSPRDLSTSRMPSSA